MRDNAPSETANTTTVQKLINHTLWVFVRCFLKNLVNRYYSVCGDGRPSVEKSSYPKTGTLGEVRGKPISIQRW